MVTDFYKDRDRLSFTKKLDKDTFVNMLGTGTIGFHTETISIKIEDFPPKNMNGFCDLTFAIIAKKQNVSMICLAREENYLIEQKDPVFSLSIWSQTVNNCSEQTNLVNQYMPWPILTHKKRDSYL